MSYEMTVERLFDASPGVVFDTWFDPDAQEEIFSEGMPPGYSLLEFEIDLRVGGTCTVVIGPEEGEPDRITYVFTEVDRPHHMACRSSMFVGEWGRTVDFTMSMTFREQDGKTLLTLEQAGFDTEADRDSFRSGLPGFLDGMAKTVASRANA
jgi:uncharacterized protein YndB with AHSA1/START domain